MVIHQFNKLIRNKFIWGAFAIIISAFFAFDFLLDDIFDSRGPNGSAAGKLAGEEVRTDLFQTLAEDVRGFGDRRDWRRPVHEVNLEAWKTLAAMKVAEANLLEPTEAEIQEIIRNDRTFQQDGVFSFPMYQAVLRENGLSPERFEDFLRRRVTLQRVLGVVSECSTWASPAELDRASADMTDKFTVRVARFKQTADEAKAVKVDDAAVKAWYEKNGDSLALPERVKIRFIRYDATDKASQAKVTVTEEALRDRYDVTIDKYTSTDTNGVETVKKFEDVKDEIEADLRLIETVTMFETNLNRRVWEPIEGEQGSRLDTLAREDSLKVQTSDWFTTGDAFQEGFMKRVYQILPGSKDLAETVAMLDPESSDYRYGIVLSDKAVWVIEKSEVSPAHTPTFEEAKSVIVPRVLRDAKADAFKAKVEKIVAAGKDAVLKTDDVSTNITFTVFDLRGREFDDQSAVVRAAVKLEKDGVSGFEPTGVGKGIVVVCENREKGDQTQALILRKQLRDQITALQSRGVTGSWSKWNLDRTGFTPGEGSTVTPVEEVE